MGTLTAILLVAVGLLGAAFSQVLAEEFKAWCPYITRALIRAAVNRLPQADRPRSEEEWSAHVDELPGSLSKLFCAAGFVIAAAKISEHPTGALAAKRFLDVVVSSVALIVLAPLLIVVSVIIGMDRAGPVLFTQVRFGKDRKLIRVYKFRSMRLDPCDVSGFTRTVQGDLRITPIGRFIRRTKIDELPQLLNVLKGDMSLVGPRCHPLGMLAAGVAYEDLVPNYHDRHLMKPGITGLAQARGLRGPTSKRSKAKARIAADIHYIKNYSLMLDLKICGRTILSEFLGALTISGHDTSE